MNKVYKQFDLFADLNGENENGLHAAAVEEAVENSINIIKENCMEEKMEPVCDSVVKRILESEPPTYRIALSEAKQKPNRGKVYTRTLEDYDEIVSSEWLKKMFDEIRAGNEALKMWLPFRLTHYWKTIENQRKQEAIVRRSFLRQTTVDVDDREYVEKAIERAYETDKQEGLWKGHLLHMEYSAHKKLHIDIRIPRGMTIAEAQQEYCRVMGIPYDESCTSPERMIYLSPISEEIYRSPDWYRGPDEELDETVPNCDGQDAMFKGKNERSYTGHTQPDKNDNAVQEVLPVPPTEESADGIMYKGFSIREIVEKYWALNNDGECPTEGDRNTKTFELACALRHILGFNRELLNKAIPNYDGFSQEEKMLCIDNALHQPRTYQPLKLTNVLEALKAEQAEETGQEQDSEEAEQTNNLRYANRLPKKMGLGIDAALKWLKKDLHMPALIALAPALGALLTHIRLLVFGDMNTLNLQSFIVGEAGTGKRKFVHIINALMKHFYAESRANLEANNKNRKERARKRNTKDVPVFDLLPERAIPAQHSMAQVLDMLHAANGDCCYTLSEEADIMTGNGKQAFAKTSALRRVAFDGGSYEQAYKSDEASRLFIPHVRWNLTQCGTPDALLRAYPNTTDGELSRIAIAPMPDNTFDALVVGRVFGEKESAPLEKLGSLLPLMQGDVELPKLEEHALKRIEEFRMECLKNDDRVAARTRMRIPVIAMRMVCALTACSFAAYLVDNIDKANQKPDWADGAQTAEEYLKQHPEATAKYMKRVQNKSMMALYDILTEYLTETMLYYFRGRIEKSYQSEDYLPSGRTKRGKNDVVFEKLPQTFTLKEAAAARGTSSAGNKIRGMVYQWQKQGLVKNIDNGKYEKISSR